MTQGRSTRSDVLSMGQANVIATGLQFLLPIALVRIIDVESFGQYRLFWLLASSVMLIGPLGVPRSLHYFLPRVSADKKSAFVRQTLLFLTGMGVLAFVSFNPLNPFLSGNVLHLVEQNESIAGFLMLWVVASLIEILPAADQRVKWQAIAIILLSVIRAASIVLVAWFTRDIRWIINIIFVFAAIRTLVLLYYIKKYHPVVFRKQNQPTVWREHLSHAIPFGLTGMLNKIRPVSEQWIVAFLFGVAEFGAFTLAAGILPLLNVLKKSVGFVTVPKMSKLHKQGKWDELKKINTNGNIAVSFILFPILVYLFVFSHDVISVLYTSQYTKAADILRIYIIGVAVMCVEVSSILIVFQQGRFVMLTSIILTVSAIITSYYCARYLGLAGAAMGSVLSMIIGSIIYYIRSARLLACNIYRLQDWPSLAIIMISAVIACSVAFYCTHVLMIDSHFYSTVIGGIISIFLYFVGLKFMGKWWLVMAILGRGKWKGAVST